MSRLKTPPPASPPAPPPAAEPPAQPPAEPAGFPDLPRLLTRKEAAELLRVSERTLFTITARDRIPVVRVGARVLYNPRDLADWLREHTQ